MKHVHTATRHIGDIVVFLQTRIISSRSYLCCKMTLCQPDCATHNSVPKERNESDESTERNERALLSRASVNEGLPYGQH